MVFEDEAFSLTGLKVFLFIPCVPRVCYDSLIIRKLVSLARS